MTFNFACCELCNSVLWNPEDLVSFTLKNKGLVEVELKGQQPWSGVRCVCLACSFFLSGVANDRR